jgi:hypothetical protein
MRIEYGRGLMKPVWGPALMLVVGMSAGCIADDDESGIDAPFSCGDPDAYTPYETTVLPSGDTTALPWRGETASYPNGREAFDVYSTSSMIECGSTKDKRSYLDVTAGCLTGVTMGDGAYHRAQVSLTDTAAFRALALGYSNGERVKWTGQRGEYRFYYTGATGDGANPGFKVFTRYRTEDDLYVASWRLDGVVQIQKKQCGEYTAIARLEDQPIPSVHTWHRIRFDAIGSKLSLYLDDELALTADDPAFSWGTVGIRIDGVTGTYLDDWRVF